MRRSGSGNGAFWMAGVVSVVVLAVGIAWVSGRFSAPEGPEVPVPVVSSEGAGGSSMKAAQDVADAVPGSGASADGAAGSDEPAPLPRLDEVRHESDGLVVIAGRVAPFADIILRLDGLEFARASADGAGAFATVATLEPSTAARVLTLTQIKDGGGEILSPDELILAPVQPLAAAEQVAERDDTAETLTKPIEEAARDEAQPGGDDAVIARDTPAEMDQADTESSTQVAAHDRPADAHEEDHAEVADPSTVDRTDEPDRLAVLSLRAENDGPDGGDTADATHEAEPASVAMAPEAASSAPAQIRSADPFDGEPLARPAFASRVPGAVAQPKADLVSPQAPQPGAGQQIVILRSNEEGVSVVRPADPKPQAMRQVALDSISYSDAGDVELQGRAQTAAQQVRVYLDNRPVAALDVTAAGNWRGSLPAIDTGVYTLRIDEIDAAGRVTSRVETPFKRESPEVLAAATQDGPLKVSAVTVQKGDTLWAISRERYGEGILYVRVFEANRTSIRNPDLIYPGQVFTLPGD